MASTATVTVREIAPQDFEAVAELSVRAYAALGPVHPLYEPVLRDVASRAAEGEVLVAEHEGRVVGAVTIADGGPLAEISRSTDELEFRMLAVDPDAQGLGVGARLIDHVLYTARARGRRRIVISTQPSMTAAHGLYERRGFVRTPERDWSPHDPVLLITYALDLDPTCTRCGQDRASGDHEACAAASQLEPPRYCGACGRRMVVQVVPTGWTARCSEHGDTRSE